MSNIKVLDCTLRDGGYVNDWDFKKNNIKRILEYLTESKIEFIECGFLSNNKEYNPDKSIFDTIERISSFLPKEKRETKYVCMVNYGEYELTSIPDFDGSSVDGIRVAFHKKDLCGAIKLCEGISRKGYFVSIQPMVTNTYTDMELLELIEIANKINPSAFYIADSFGVMKKAELIRMFYLIDNNLNKDIAIGYHAHNNMQLAYSNAQSFIETNTKRTKIIDSSVFGMGRGAGNLNTELFIQYLNNILHKDYKVYPLLQIIDDFLNPIYSKSYWGYSLPHFLSATYICHPNYASYLSDKNTLTVKSISEILSSISIEKRVTFNKEYIENLYLKYQKHHIDDKKSVEYLRKIFSHRNIMIIAPGSSIDKYYEKINKVISEEDALVVSVNFILNKHNVDFVFISNEKRYEKIINLKKQGTDKSIKILTSNIVKKGNNYDISINYIDLLNNTNAVRDNSTLMLLKLLTKLNTGKIYISGLDGYDYNEFNNYVSEDMVFSTSDSLIKEMNNGMVKEISTLSNELDINFVTPTRYITHQEIAGGEIRYE